MAELTELDISRDQKVIDACGNGKAASPGCTEARVEAIAAKNGYETGPYNSKFSQQYPDAYGQLVGLLNSTTPDAQNQQKVTEGLANYFMAATGVDYETALGYAKTKQGVDTIISSLALGANLQAVHSYLVSKGAVATAGSIRNVNPGHPISGRTHNCVNCVIATDATLAGNPASALPNPSNKAVPLTVLEKQFGTKFRYVSSPESITQQMMNAGSGARGVVYGSYGIGQPGHVFNVVNQNGTIRFLDGQTGKPADLSQFKSFQILRTN